jgi:hypothetical protein
MPRKNDTRGVARVAKNLRFREDLAKRIQESADANGRSWNAEIHHLAAWALWFLGGQKGAQPEVIDAQ